MKRGEESERFAARFYNSHVLTPLLCPVSYSLVPAEASARSLFLISAEEKKKKDVEEELERAWRAYTAIDFTSLLSV